MQEATPDRLCFFSINKFGNWMHPFITISLFELGLIHRGFIVMVQMKQVISII